MLSRSSIPASVNDKGEFSSRSMSYSLLLADHYVYCLLCSFMEEPTPRDKASARGMRLSFDTKDSSSSCEPELEEF